MENDFSKTLSQIGDDSWDSVSESFLNDESGVKETLDYETQKLLNYF
tara:strand:+ start:129 stop:269 length:141 start_codon:yes stop_codon:yes gene_type:complete